MITIPETDLVVHELCLGTNVFGWSAVSLAWLRSNPQLSTPIASARTVEQLEEIVQIIDSTQQRLMPSTKSAQATA